MIIITDNKRVYTVPYMCRGSIEIHVIPEAFKFSDYCVCLNERGNIVKNCLLSCIFDENGNHCIENITV